MNIAATRSDDPSRLRYQCLHFRVNVRRTARFSSRLGLVAIISPSRLACLLDELDEKLQEKFEVAAEDAAIIREKLESIAEIVRPDMVLHVITEDPDDNRVLECAIRGMADYIVTGDHHLLKLGSYDAISIVTVRQFLDEADLEE